ncbi:hypothetical protein BS47DRAFT_1397417 [Hydnum rufescens UP504]|uniref:Uncharacterized protein n=1 Tax=Hydnum rufescens UP504 TaxID=1448309 RepID=A0A9P6ANL3_9AGAM|nr:hypothetical protein BS47DRAFT_1397417 [Hydnum rufescens UP504]
MASNNPLNPADMHRVYISEKYRLHFTIKPPSTVTGLHLPKSEYITPTCEAVTWKDPFGDEFMVTPTPIDCKMAIDLCKHRFGCKGQIVASCALDLSSATGNEIRLDLQGAANDKVGELTICMASSLPPPSDAVGSTNLAVQQLGPGLAMINNTIQAATPLATEVMAQFNAWRPLLSGSN